MQRRFTKLAKASFTAHDIRKIRASETSKFASQAASAALAHSSTRTTMRYYMDVGRDQTTKAIKELYARPAPKAEDKKRIEARRPKPFLTRGEQRKTATQRKREAKAQAKEEAKAEKERLKEEKRLKKKAV